MLKQFKLFLFVLILFSIILISLNLVFAAYVADVYFTVPNTVYTTNERIEILGYVYLTNLSLTNTSAALPNATVNLTIRNTNGTSISNYTFTTDSNGAFYSKSNYYSLATEITAPSTAGTFSIKTEYIDPLNTTWFSEVEISVINQTIDLLAVSSDKAKYYPSENINVNVEAIKLIGDRILYVSNISVNGSIRSSAKTSLQTFNCTTGNNGKCAVSIIAPTYGNYILELNDFKAFSSFSVVAFSYNVYMKDELGKSLKNVFSLGEQARVEVRIANATTSDEYTFSGYISDSSGNVVKSISSTSLTNNNSFTNSFLFTVDTQFSYGAYSAYVTATKTGGGSISSPTSFQVKDWSLTINKKTTNSGFEYEYSTFPNQTIRFEALPTYRSNGSVIANINSSSFTINLKDNLNNVIASANVTWNASCGTNGCYEFSLISPSNTDRYTIHVTLSYSGSVQTESRIINVINGVMSAQSTDKDGSIKELFGTNEYVYLTLSSYNLTNSQFNLTDAEIYLVSYMNGSELSYTNVNNFASVNASNSAYEWAWNVSLQKIKLDVPKFGGVYNVFIFGNNRTLGAVAKFIVNPYDVCYSAKNTPGQAGGSTGYYYVWQFKTSDTVYFELKITQANNPLGRATASNMTGGNGTGMGAQCNVDTQTKQVISNATITLTEVKNLESGTLQNINTTESTCQASDNSGGYTCTVKPLTKWEGGQNIVKFNIVGQDGTTSIAYSRFEARAFYLYGWSQQWQNNPSSNITLSIQMYEAGTGWWGGGGSGGLSGTVSVKKVEYQGRDGEWLWPPIDSGYNVSALNSSSITSSSYNNYISLPAQYAPGGTWKTGYYRVILQATTSSGDTDYGYAWFGVKLWDVYGQPIECTSTSCNYKSYFNSKENITLYITINKAGAYWWSSNTRGGDIYGNVTIGIKKIQNCRTWPCKDMNSSEYAANTINVNESSPGYWYANIGNQSKYLIQINKTTGSWGTGYYSVVLDVNGTDTGYAWFNTIAFYVEIQPTDSNGSNYKYSIKGSQPMYFNVTTTKSYKWSYYGGARYNLSDYVNTTVDDAVLRTWDQQTWQSKEYNYPEDINVTPLNVNGNTLLNVTFRNGTWPAGYYWGELTLRNSENETSTGWLWFEVRPFRVQVSSSTYEIDSDQCINSSLNVYEPWWPDTPLYGNYSVTSIYENIWSGYAPTSTYYGNYSINSSSNSSSFNATTTITICPNSGQWTGGSWGGYHYLNIIVKDNSDNSTQIGWLWFRTVPFRVTWSSVGSKLTNENVEVRVSLTKPSSGANTTGNLTKLYQWRYDNYQSTREEYVFKIGNCYSNVSGQCIVNGTQNVTIYAPSGGWRVGYNYVQAEWTKDNDASVTVQDWSGVYFDGREAYNGWFDNYDANWNWKYYFAFNENITIKLNVRDSSYSNANVNITNVWYAFSGDNCWSEYCRSYTSATFSPTNTSNGAAILNIQTPVSNWSRGYYSIKARVSGSNGTATITGGTVRVKDMTPPNITLISPVNNATYNSTLIFNANTTKNAQCSIYIINYDNFYNWYCWNWNSTNSTNSSSAQTEGACNMTKYGYSGSSYYYEYIYRDYHSIYNGTVSSYCYNYYGSSSCYGSDLSRVSTYVTTGGTTHTYTLNLSNFQNQHYGMSIWCYDDDYNYASTLVAFKVNVTSTQNASNVSDTTSPLVTINSPANTTYNTSSILFNFTLNENGTCMFSLNSGATNYTMSTTNNRNFNATNSSIGDGNYIVRAYCNDTSGNWNRTEYKNFTVDTTYPSISYSGGTPNDYSNLTSSSIYVNVSVTETNFKNITFLLWNSTSQVNLTTYTSLITNINWTNLPYTNYTFNVSIYDTVGHFNSTSTRHVNLSAS